MPEEFVAIPGFPTVEQAVVKAFIYSKGSVCSGGYPDIDALFQRETDERDQKKRPAILYKIQQKAIDRAMFAPLMGLRSMIGIGPRITKDAIGDMARPVL
jgi:hypothetical protein